MTGVLPMVVIFICTVTCIAKENKDVCHGGKGEIHPGLTVFEKSGQFFKTIGPIYGNYKLSISPHSFRLSQEVIVRARFQTTKEIYSVFASGAIYYQNSTYFSYDEDEDLCIVTNILCPVQRCGIRGAVYKFYPKDVGLLPGLYSGKIDVSSVDENYSRFHMFGIEFKLRLEK